MSDDDIKSGREALDLAAQLTSWRMLTKPRQQPRPPRGNVVQFPRQPITERDMLTMHPSKENENEKQ
jgi:hypothetical protein